jgi:hypothetical protein
VLERLFFSPQQSSSPVSHSVASWLDDAPPVTSNKNASELSWLHNCMHVSSSPLHLLQLRHLVICLACQLPVTHVEPPAQLQSHGISGSWAHHFSKHSCVNLLSTPVLNPLQPSCTAFAPVVLGGWWSNMCYEAQCQNHPCPAFLLQVVAFERRPGLLSPAHIAVVHGAHVALRG